MIFTLLFTACAPSYDCNAPGVRCNGSGANTFDDAPSGNDDSTSNNPDNEDETTDEPDSQPDSTDEPESQPESTPEPEAGWIAGEYSVESETLDASCEFYDPSYVTISDDGNVSDLSIDWPDFNLNLYIYSCAISGGSFDCDGSQDVDGYSWFYNMSGTFQNGSLYANLYIDIEELCYVNFGVYIN